MWGSKKGQGAHWLGRRASEKTSWRRLESRVGWNHREECDRGFRQRARLGQRHGRENGQGRGRRGTALSSSLLSGLLFVGYPWLCMGASEVAQWHPLQTGYSKSPGGAMASGHTAQPDWLGQQCPSSVSGSGAPSGVSEAVGIGWSGQCFTVHPEPGTAGRGKTISI